MAATNSKAERRERLEKLRLEAKRAERRRTLLMVGAFGSVCVLIIGLTAWALLNERQRAQQTAATDLAAIGPDATAAGCAEATTQPAEGSAQHVDGQQVPYDTAPPAFGPHWGTPAGYEQKFYTDADRPEVEQLMHNLEHGYTILWYDQTIADDDSQLQVVRDVAAKFDVGSPTDLAAYNAGKFIAAPWTVDDGGAFPDGAHVALTHWAGTGPDAVPGQGLGVWRYCQEPSGAAVAEFTEQYPAENSPEPDAE